MNRLVRKDNLFTFELFAIMIRLRIFFRQKSQQLGIIPPFSSLLSDNSEVFRQQL